LFEPFFTTKAKGIGTGLGLSMVHEIVKQSGGHITVQSERGRGSTFHIYLPISREPAHAASTELTYGETPRGAQTVLVAEDEDDIRVIARRTLERHGYKILEASSGIEAVELSEQYAAPIHLLMTDIPLQSMNGYDLAQRLRCVRPELKVLFTSGFADDIAPPINGMAANTHFLQKPFSPRGLAVKIREIFA